MRVLPSVSFQGLIPRFSRPINTHLLEKDTPFVFSQDCINAFETLKKKLTEAPILVVPDWNLPFELMCDASDFAIGAVLGQRKVVYLDTRLLNSSRLVHEGTHQGDDPFSGSTTTHSNDPSPSSSPVKTSDNYEKFADELAPLDSLPPGNDDSTLKKDLHEENFQVYSNPLFDEIEEDVEIKNSNVSDEPVFNTPLSDKVECFAPEDNDDEIDAFLAMEVSSNSEEGYFDSEGDVIFLDNLLSDLVSEVEQNESSITFSPRSDPLHHEFAGELITLPSRNDREFGEYLSLMTVLCEISTSQSQENVHANQNDLIPPNAENDDSEDEDNELPNLDHQDDPSIPRPPPEPPDVEKCFEPEAGILITKAFKCVSKPHDFMADIFPTLPTLVSYLTFILFLSSFLSFGSEDTVFDPGIVMFHKPVAVSMKVSCSKYCSP
ncbi:reverse transcriptase domain-containing protein [Tanacetum coccineum]